MCKLRCWRAPARSKGRCAIVFMALLAKKSLRTRSRNSGKQRQMIGTNMRTNPGAPAAQRRVAEDVVDTHAKYPGPLGVSPADSCLGPGVLPVRPVAAIEP